VESIPPRGWFVRALPWLVVAIVLGGFALGFSRGTGFGTRRVAEWVLINGTRTAIGAVLARAHPLTCSLASSPRR